MNGGGGGVVAGLGAVDDCVAGTGADVRNLIGLGLDPEMELVDCLEVCLALDLTENLLVESTPDLYRVLVNRNTSYAVMHTSLLEV